LVGCDRTIDLTIETPPDALRFSLTDADLALPAELQAGSTIASVACDETQPCPPAIGDYGFSCVNAVCDPNPLPLVMPVGDVDFAQLNSELNDIVGNIQSIHIDFVRYNVTQNDLAVPMDPVELAWGPAQSTDFTSPGVFPLGRLENWGLGTHELDLHEAGVNALSDFLVHTSRQIRVLARTQVDLALGQALPAGALVTDLQLSITVTGQVL
jgi:hypothetical protein